MKINFDMRACGKATKWLKTQPDAQTAWANCERGDWMWWALRHLSGAMPKKKVNVAFARWCAGRAKEVAHAAADTAHAAAYAAHAAAYAAHAAADVDTAHAAAAAYAAYAAAYAHEALDTELKAQADWIRKHIKCPIP